MLMSGLVGSIICRFPTTFRTDVQSFFKPIQFYLQPANLAIEAILFFLGGLLAFPLAPTKRLVGALQQLLLPIIDLAGMHRKF
jgi:hypothetical protein